jgi:purine-nucleoside phosphorylase
MNQPFNTALYLQQIEEAVQSIRSLTNQQVDTGIILGTGLGGLVKEIRVEREIPYDQIRNFPLSTVESHAGKLIFGHLNGKSVVAMQGRFHYYEGYPMQQITFPVRVLFELGVRTLIISNAAGGMNPQFVKGDIMLMTDHINLIGDNPLIGPNLDKYGPRFPDMSEAYARELITLAERIALEHQIPLRKGVYIAVAGPNMETAAEYRMLRAMGGDVVGMSTVPENIVAVHMGMRVLGISVVTDECFPDALKPVSLEEVIAVASAAEPKLTRLMKEVIKHL